MGKTMVTFLYLAIAMVLSVPALVIYGAVRDGWFKRRPIDF